MRFNISCMMGAFVAQQVAAENGISTVLDIFGKDFIYEQTFWQNYLQNLQRDTENTASDCMGGFDSMQTLYAQTVEYVTSDVQYTAGLIAKGQGAGTNFGFILDKSEKYIDLFTSFTNLFNQCDVEYYLIALSKATSNVAGSVNQIINTVWRSNDSTLYDEMRTAIDADDAAATAVLLATFTKDFLMAEIPDKSSAGSYQEAGTVM